MRLILKTSGKNQQEIESVKSVFRKLHGFVTTIVIAQSVLIANKSTKTFAQKLI